ncbi:MAG: hypothetical protein COA79_20155 [Planctomycetota bacterium]|nr:MAG: hypothetical protein COA79_20155 [Planctomycetota bacterium]
MKKLSMDIPKIVPPIKVKQSDVYMLVILDSDGIYHYFDNDGDYDGYSYDLDVPIEDNPN